MSYSPLVRLRRFMHGFLVVKCVNWYYRTVWGMHIGPDCRISLSAKLDKANPDGIVIGKSTAITFGAAILSHDFVNNVHSTTRIGDYCFIGAHAVIMPGITVGDHSIVATGAIVMRDVPPHTVVMGNPARPIEQNIQTGRWGIRIRDPQNVPPNVAVPASPDKPDLKAVS
ncbi:acyltransferase [Sphingobium fluviale]|uniref:Acyltransferase n=1 Tax=Sphingobium fluviale TaxID=2506423 RepID=A0A4Q1KP29_9SPHN|nr:acyltransferase [Sphingobium fluviale]RXR31190.1 acyltransferase [Sphingobium fluviale]